MEVIQPSEIMFVEADTASVLSLFTAQRANQVLRLYPEQILLPCWLTEKQAQVQINVLFFVSLLKFGLECFVQWDASSNLSDGREPQPLSPRSKVLLMMKERKRARETNFSETRAHIKRQTDESFIAKEEASAIPENKTTICSVNYECFK